MDSDEVLLLFNTHCATLAEDYYFTMPGYVGKLKIPKGFSFDGSSHPRTFNSIVGGRYKPKLVVPSMIHDYLLTETTIERSSIHKRYYQELKRNKVRWAYLFYLAVKWYDYIMTKFKG